MHKETKKNFSQVIKDLHDYGALDGSCTLLVDVNDTLIVNPKNGRAAGMISKTTYDVVMANAEALDSAVIYDRDFHYQ